MLGKRGTDMHVKMLYTDESNRETVYALIVETMVTVKAEQLWSLYPELNAYIASQNLALRTHKRDLLFTYPKSLTSIVPIVLQGIDGDMFA